MQHKEYKAPEIEILLIGDADVITTSGFGSGDNVDNPDDLWDF